MQILIQHTRGSKSNSVDQFETDALSEITFGRDPASTIAFDPAKDDAVSRTHAKLTIRKENGPAFLLRDNNSTNGTRVNGRRITAETELFPEDQVELGSGGPTFTFDLNPRPAGLVARTRIVGNTIIAPATRMSPETYISPAPQTTAVASTMMSGGRGVGRETVMGLLQQERRATSRLWLGITAVVLIIVVLGGGGLYWRMSQDKTQINQQLAETNRQTSDLRQGQQAQSAASALLEQKVGMLPEQIVRQFGSSIVQIFVRWRLYDATTGKPVFLKTFRGNSKSDSLTYSAFIRQSDKTLLPWLTIEGGRDTPNLEMRGTQQGSGFIVNEEGFIITNKHVAAGWLVHSFDPKNMSIVIFDPDVRNEPFYYPDGRGLSQGDVDQIGKWIPRDGAPIFDIYSPKRIGGTTEGRNDILEVQFPGRPLAIAGTKIRHSERVDMALIKISMPKKYPPLEMNEISPSVGSSVTIIGYPQRATETEREYITIEAGDMRRKTEVIPEPSVTAGIVARQSDPYMTGPGFTTRSELGDLYELEAAADHGDSGGPVFDSQGKVIGVLTYIDARRETKSYAVPIKYARELLE